MAKIVARRGFLSALVGMLVGRFASAESTDRGQKRRFYVTAPGTIIEGDMPVYVEAVDRLDAVMQLDLTVWTEEEWKEAQKLNEAATLQFPDGEKVPLFKEPVPYWNTTRILENRLHNGPHD